MNIFHQWRRGTLLPGGFLDHSFEKQLLAAFLQTNMVRWVNLLRFRTLIYLASEICQNLQFLIANLAVLVNGPWTVGPRTEPMVIEWVLGKFGQGQLGPRAQLSGAQFDHYLEPYHLVAKFASNSSG